MRLTFCVACGERDLDLLEHHHLLPRAEGGPDTEDSLITLCLKCHGIVHGRIRRPYTDLWREKMEASRVQRMVSGGTGKLVAKPLRIPDLKKREDTLRAKAEGYAAFSTLIDKLKARGFTSYGLLAKKLNALGMRTPRGHKWKRDAVLHRIQRIDRFFANHPNAREAEKPVKPSRARGRATPVSHWGHTPLTTP